jgi:hypothetical protein
MGPRGDERLETPSRAAGAQTVRRFVRLRLTALT